MSGECEKCGEHCLDCKCQDSVRKMQWISIKDKLPPCSPIKERKFMLAHHSIHGVGIAWFCILEDLREEFEEDYEDKYLCSCHFVKSTLCGNHCIDSEEDIDIFQNSPHFRNLGTVTHWMLLPKSPT